MTLDWVSPEVMDNVCTCGAPLCEALDDDGKPILTLCIECDGPEVDAIMGRWMMGSATL